MGNDSNHSVQVTLVDHTGDRWDNRNGNHRQGGIDMKYEVWIEFINYRGQVTDSAQVAAFCSRERAEEYLEFCGAEDDNLMRYVIAEK